MVFAVHGKLLNQEVNDNTYKKQIETIAKKQPEEHFWSQQETESSLAGHLGSCLAQHEWERESEMERGKLPLRRSFTAAAAIIYLKIIATSITGQRHTESESQSETQRSLKRTPVPEHFIIIGQQQIVADRRFAALVFFLRIWRNRNCIWSWLKPATGYAAHAQAEMHYIYLWIRLPIARWLAWVGWADRTPKEKRNQL